LAAVSLLFETWKEKTKQGGNETPVERMAETWGWR